MVWIDGPGWVLVAPLAPLEPRGDWATTVRRSLDGSGWPVATVACFTYEGGALFEQMPAPLAESGLPPVWLGQIEAAFLWDHHGLRIQGRPGAVERLAALPPVSTPAPPAATGRARRLTTPAQFRRGVRTILDHLRSGDCYQVNLARELRVTHAGDPLDAWRRLRRQNPARRGFYLEMPHATVVSNSPELLLEARRGRVRSAPIKGTAPRLADRDASRAEALRLLQSPKERAELTMITDLVRSDLARVVLADSLSATPRRVGAVGHVWHAIREVRGTLAPGRDALDAFGVLFPAGSVTGAPKVRAMELIRALEPGPRGAYCGSIGWFGSDSSARFNVAIRTITFRGGEASLHVGAGIVLGSDPEREYAETELKAARMLESLCA